MSERKRKDNRKDENAVLQILSSQTADGETERSELNSTACYSCSAQEVRIKYTELDENGEESGETVITVLADRLVTIQKTGFTEAVMILEQGKTHPITYNTVVGSMQMMLCALEIHADFHSDGGRLLMRYLIDIGETYSAMNTIDLRVSLR
ncbi:MAG: DUF1934 domain-containing protein [Oscillospiraceae bacterium]|nr:DUF1934 domain-containing protein [Oscillospiraceae bacterium]